MAANNKKKKKSNSKNIAIIATCSILALILIIVLCVYLVLKSYIGKINKVDPDDWSNITSNTNEVQTDDDGNVISDTTMSDEINSSGAENFGDGEGLEKDYVKNIVLILRTSCTIRAIRMRLFSYRLTLRHIRFISHQL